MIGKESQTERGKEKKKKNNRKTPKLTPAQKRLGSQSGERDEERGIREASSGESAWVQVCCFAELLKASLIFRR